MSYFDSLTPKEFVILTNLVAFILTEGRSADDNTVLGTFITNVGASMLAIATQQENIKDAKDIRRPEL
ncbi:hypothetical protein CPAST_c11380 [Clostridium pasteurianum DSM 525 = ATCC 6013]|uniref:Uncharacterized protein n=1 Tax=Clostridium pasteurianum DSM 525 = ATCC 6013 TaxID=1262449 RepID=A0A0H3J5R0_CLOPA|nr:hypothetical protein [Clostridium pasteurianum]AJA47238.1 hypothetical protein CPAST_c11380 [Clostridium pasteurianum DSM 525 = ATCC 6013]AJA51226.1 hypothetical protein CLPA_c11380 [Clostridium pasteurianum DSM 525 = ATCC 6013]AOZ74589.1 hypothetical protein AQ983_05505 [Clostridium pasteurianum DSM 525 = ATCC 6013]AOZ78386.1 hypothetical protein AQ984_05495 [Clostridium pasteurianum]ELP59378.1 hypothetical protein F502_08843 [Clostridium pasteurianum DSM 525 = ATCC 6013]